MVKVCDNKRIDEILSYIGSEYYKCLYLYIDMLQYGCSSEFTKTWVQEDNGEIKAVMLAYHSAMHIYSKQLKFDVQELTKFLLEKNPSIICASAELIKLLEPQMSSNGFVSEYGHIGKFIHCEPSSVSCDIRIANKDDIMEIAKLLYDDDDIGSSYTMDDLVKQIEERLESGFVRSYVIKDGNHVVAHLGTGAEVDKLCTVSYVITHPEYRGRGLSSSLFSYACNQLSLEGKEIFSVYYPENSRRLHHKMGFVDCCEFGKLYRNIQ